MANRFKSAPGSCKGKVRHDSPAQVRAAIVSVHQRLGGLGGDLSVYRCRVCGKYHWGHAPGSRRSEQRAEPYKRRPKHRHRTEGFL